MTLDEARTQLAWQVDLIPAGASNRPRGTITPSHITIHNTANAGAGADALSHGRYLKGPDARARKVSWHYSVDDQRVVQHLPDRELGWHAGIGNRRSIGIEICEHQGIDQGAANDRAALLTAVLIHIHRIPLDAVVPHQVWTGKNCPRTLLAVAGAFDAFVAAVKAHATELSGGAPLFLSTESLAMETGPIESSPEALDGDCAARVRVLERLLGRALADAELLREELEVLKTDTYEAP